MKEACVGTSKLMECQKCARDMSLESADPHDSDVLREKNRILGKSVKNALFVVRDAIFFYGTISCA